MYFVNFRKYLLEQSSKTCDLEVILKKSKIIILKIWGLKIWIRGCKWTKWRTGTRGPVWATKTTPTPTPTGGI